MPCQASSSDHQRYHPLRILSCQVLGKFLLLFRARLVLIMNLSIILMGHDDNNPFVPTTHAISDRNNNGGGPLFSIHERHQFSLTTFDPNGKLAQVEHAMLAASMGIPIIMVGVSANNNRSSNKKYASASTNTILLAAPQILPSRWMDDDGTPRFVQIAPHLVVGHSGITADGRLVMEAAQRMALEHSYTFDEPIPLSLFLEELSLLFQEYTMRPLARPFGCTLVVGHLPSTPQHPPGEQTTTTTITKPRLFRIDCSGAVSELDTVAVIHPTLEKDRELQSALKDFVIQREEDEEGIPLLAAVRKTLARILEEAMERMKPSSLLSTSKMATTNSGGDDGYVNNEDDDDDNDNGEQERGLNQETSRNKLPLRIIVASFDRNNGMLMERHSTRQS